MPNLAALLLGLYAAYYIILEWFAGLTWTAFVALPVFVTANALQQVLRGAMPIATAGQAVPLLRPSCFAALPCI